jgi:hypothetical protein
MPTPTRTARITSFAPQFLVADLDRSIAYYQKIGFSFGRLGSRWNSTTVYRRVDGALKSIHSHWSFTRHAAFQNMLADASERQGE